MSAPVIRVENLGKRYVLNHQGKGGADSGDGLRHVLQDAIAAGYVHHHRRYLNLDGFNSNSAERFARF